LRTLLIVIFLTSLIGCTTKTEYRYIKPVIPEPPPEPAYYPVEWKKHEFDNGPHYCLDKDNARNFLINKQLQDSYTQKLREILKLLRDRYGKHGRGN